MIGNAVKLVAAPVEQKSAAPVTLVQNWTALLKKK
jgi:hypothetical protein